MAENWVRRWLSVRFRVLLIGLVGAAVLVSIRTVTRTYGPVALFLIAAAIIGLGAFYYCLPPRGWKRQPRTPKR
jgi:hypothetical protein